MRLPALALTVRSLRVENRAHRAFVLRAGLVLALIAVLGDAESTSRFYGAPGGRFFGLIVYVDLLFVMLIGVGAFAGVITEEKEDRTLGLLKLCGFDPIAILLGKSVAQLAAAGLLLAVQIPFAMLAITLGGVSAVQVTAAYWILGAFTLLVYGTALWCSVVCRRTGSAARLTLILVIALLVVPPLATALLGAWSTVGTVAQPGAIQAMCALSAWQAMGRVVATGYDESFPAGPVYFNVAVAAGFMVLAWLSFARANREDWAPAQARGPLPWQQTAARRHGRPRHRPRSGRRAFVWKDYHFVAGGSRAITLRVLGYAALFLLCWLIARGSGGSAARVVRTVGRFVMPWMCVALGLETLRVGARVFHEEARWNTLAGLVVTPLRLRSWAWAKVFGSLPVLLPAVGFFGLAVFLLFSEAGSTSVLAALMYFLSVAFCGGHVAALLSLLMRRGAVAATVALIVMAHFAIGVVMTAASPGSPEEALLIMAALLTGFALLLHGVIGRVILRVAGRG